MSLRKIPLQLLLYSTIAFIKASGLADPITALAQETILSKAHATAIFQMTKNEWNESAIDLDDKGAAEAVVNSAGTYMVQLRYGNDAYLYVVPKYNLEFETPINIKVTLAIPPTMALMFDQKTIERLAEQTKLEMLPEFNVSMTHEIVSGGVALFFLIMAH